MEIDKSYYTRFSEYVIVSPQWKRRWARFISGALSPLSIAIAAMALACYSLDNDSALSWMALYLVLSILPPTIYIMYLVRKGIVSDFHLNVREERTKPLLIMTVNAALVFIVMVLLGAPKLIPVVIATAVIQLLFILLITLKWKISGHCSAIAGIVVLALALYGDILLPLVLLIPVVAWSRIMLKRHTLGQTVAGTMLGAASVSILLYFTNFL